MSHPHQPRRILVVEDDPDQRDGLSELLEEAGYAVAAVGDGARALEYLRNVGDRPSSRPDLILLDIQMPNMNGREFRQKHLTSGSDATIPVVAVTGDPTVKDDAASLELTALLSKPLNVPTLLEVIARALDAGRADHDR